MKKGYKLVFVFFVLCLFCAFTWPPEKYDMPRTILDAAALEDSLSGLQVSIGSIANVGLIILGIIISVSVISSIFRRLFLGQVNKFNPPRPRRSYSSERYSEVRERNLTSAFHRQPDSYKERGEDRL